MFDDVDKLESVKSQKVITFFVSYKWRSSEWSECRIPEDAESQCGPGIQTRSVFCSLEATDSTEAVEVDDHLCLNGEWARCSSPAIQSLNLCMLPFFFFFFFGGAVVQIELPLSLDIAIRHADRF